MFCTLTTNIDENGREVVETKDGHIFVDGSCVAEPGLQRFFHQIKCNNNCFYFESSPNDQLFLDF